MKSKLMRTVVVTSLLTAFIGTAAAIYVPQLADKWATNKAGMQPAVYTGADQNLPDQTATVAQAPVQDQQPVLRPRPRATRTYSSAAPVATDQYGEPIQPRRSRSTEDSALIVAGSAGTGAAIGAIAGGGKGAAIGALSGGVAGFIYDRITAHK